METDEITAFEESDGRVRRAFRKGLLVGCLVSIAIPVLLGVTGLVAFGILIDQGYFPDSAAVAGDDLNARTLEFLRAEELVRDDEQVAYFYSGGVFSLREDGNFFTERRVVSYWELGSELVVESAAYHDVENFSYSPEEGFFDDSRISIARMNGSSFDLIVSNEGGRDDEFFELLDRAWQERRNGDPACAGSELPAEVLEFLHAEGIVEASEEVLYFYAKTSGSLRVDGNLFTDRRVISYWESEGEIAVGDALYPEIVGIEAGWGEGPHGVTTVRMELVEGESLELWVSPAEARDRAFVSALERTWRSKR